MARTYPLLRLGSLAEFPGLPVGSPLYALLHSPSVDALPSGARARGQARGQAQAQAREAGHGLGGQERHEERLGVDEERLGRCEGSRQVYGENSMQRQRDGESTRPPHEGLRQLYGESSGEGPRDGESSRQQYGECSRLPTKEGSRQLPESSRGGRRDGESSSQYGESSKQGWRDGESSRRVQKGQKPQEGSSRLDQRQEGSRRMDQTHERSRRMNQPQEGSRGNHTQEASRLGTRRKLGQRWFSRRTMVTPAYIDYECEHRGSIPRHTARSDRSELRFTDHSDHSRLADDLNAHNHDHLDEAHPPRERHRSPLTVLRSHLLPSLHLHDLLETKGAFDTYAASIAPLPHTRSHHHSHHSALSHPVLVKLTNLASFSTFSTPDLSTSPSPDPTFSTSSAPDLATLIRTINRLLTLTPHLSSLRLTPPLLGLYASPQPDGAHLVCLIYEGARELTRAERHDLSLHQDILLLYRTLHGEGVLHGSVGWFNVRIRKERVVLFDFEYASLRGDFEHAMERGGGQRLQREEEEWERREEEWDRKCHDEMERVRNLLRWR